MKEIGRIVKILPLAVACCSMLFIITDSFIKLWILRRTSLDQPLIEFSELPTPIEIYYRKASSKASTFLSFQNKLQTRTEERKEEKNLKFIWTWNWWDSPSATIISRHVIVSRGTNNLRCMSKCKNNYIIKYYSILIRADHNLVAHVRRYYNWF